MIVSGCNGIAERCLSLMIKGLMIGRKMRGLVTDFAWKEEEILGGRMWIEKKKKKKKKPFVCSQFRMQNGEEDVS
ncbi:hypothetical protein Hanom_Chr07g00675991 [Helianthus anomalus]